MGEKLFSTGLEAENELEHIGIPRRSGRYPWGSGENPYHHGQSAPGGRRRNREIRNERRNASRNRRTLSDEELSKRITRLEKEKRLKELTYDDLYPGKREVDDALKQVGKKALIIGGTATAVVAINALVSQKSGVKVSSPEFQAEQLKLFKEYLHPKKK